MRVPDPRKDKDNVDLCQRIGSALLSIRKERREEIEDIARRSQLRSVKGTEIESVSKTISAIENGSLAVPLAQLRQILQLGYGTTLHALLVKVTSDKEKFFIDCERKNGYRFVVPELVEKLGVPATPLLIGGDGATFRWAIPIRRLKNSRTMPELHQFEDQYITTPRASDSEEVWFLLHGKLTVSLYNQLDGELSSEPRSHELQHDYAFHLGPGIFHSLKATSTAVKVPTVVFVTRFADSAEVELPAS